jgi:hypothetical protein
MNLEKAAFERLARRNDQHSGVWRAGTLRVPALWDNAQRSGVRHAGMISIPASGARVPAPWDNALRSGAWHAGMLAILASGTPECSAFRRSLLNCAFRRSLSEKLQKSLSERRNGARARARVLFSVVAAF